MVKKTKLSRLASVCLCACLCFSIFSVGSSASTVPDKYATQLPFASSLKTCIFYRDMTGSIIDSIEESAITPILNYTNGSDVFCPLLTSDATIIKFEFLFEFTEVKYVDGQTYNISFSLDIPDASTYFCIPIYSVDNYISALLAMDMAVDAFEVGSSYSPIALFRRAKGNLHMDTWDYYVISQTEDLTNISVNFTIDPGYSASFLASGDTPTIYIPFFLCFADSSLDSITLHDVTFSPVGSTKQLYSDELFQNGILGGFENLEDELSDVNDKLDDVIGSDEEGSESGIKGILQKIKDLPNALIEGIKSLFIPHDEHIQQFKDTFDELLSAHLGVLWEAPNLLIDFIQMMADFSPLRSDNFSDYYLEYPAKSIYINADADDSLDILSETDNGGVVIPLVPSNNENGTYVISFDWLGIAPYSTFYGIYKVVITFICCIGFCYFCLRKYNKLMGE